MTQVRHQSGKLERELVALGAENPFVNCSVPFFLPEKDGVFRILGLSRTGVAVISVKDVQIYNYVASTQAQWNRDHCALEMSNVVRLACEGIEYFFHRE
jgi:hypothetical protein